jgi:hypothetical protein
MRWFTTLLEVVGIAGCVVMAALSPLPWVAFGVGGVGLILISRGLTRGGTE